MGSSVFTYHRGRVVEAAFTRPADTTTYAAGDVMGTAATTPITFAGATLTGNGFTMIQKAIVYSSANVATKADIDLFLFHTTLTPAADNAAFAPGDSTLLTAVGVINFPTGGWTVGAAASGAGGNAMCVVKDIQLPIVSASASKGDMFGVMVARNAYAPISGEVFTVRLGVVD
tara:strand:+ start:3206 stop:3724 length:519 start_codon:yes stop_codon:yes gene_type:complete